MRLFLPILAVTGISAYVLGVLVETADSSQTLRASYYGSEAGSITASGEPFNERAMTAAHPSLPFGTLLTVCKDRCAEVRINDRGPDGSNGAQLDLSKGAAQRIGLDREGVGPVEVEQSGSDTELPDTGGGR